MSSDIFNEMAWDAFHWGREGGGEQRMDHINNVFSREPLNSLHMQYEQTLCPAPGAEEQVDAEQHAVVIPSGELNSRLL